MLNKSPKLAISVAVEPDRYKKGAAEAAPWNLRRKDQERGVVSILNHFMDSFCTVPSLMAP